MLRIKLSTSMSAEEKEVTKQSVLDGLLQKSFMVVSDASFPPGLCQKMALATRRAFSLPDIAKVSMVKSKCSHYLGFSGFGTEVTNGAFDRREIFDFATEPALNDSYDPEIRELSALIGPNQWPGEPGGIDCAFRETVEQYMLEMEQTYLRLLSVIEASLELAEGALSSLNTPNVQHRLKLVKYFPSEANNNNLQTQGVGVHQDKTGWLTFVQEVDTPGLEVHLKHSHCWTEARLDTGTWAINIGKAFERGTRDLISPTLHRVQAPKSGASPRHSIVFFAGLPLGLRYDTLWEIMGKSPILQQVRHDKTTGSAEYEKVLGELTPEKHQGTCFGQTQLLMWDQSYVLE